MRNILKLFVLPLSLLLLSCDANNKEVHSDKSEPTELWQGATLGMSPIEVIQLLPDTQVLPEHKIESYWGLSRLAEISKYPLFGEDFKVSFLFSEAHLKEVSLRRGNNTLAFNQKVEIALNSKYGIPLIIDDNKYSCTKRVTWLKGARDIELWYTTLPPPAKNLITIRYSYRFSDSSNRL